MQYQTEIQSASAKHGLDFFIVAGLVSTESAFNSWAMNPEPQYRYFWNVRTHAPFRALTVDEVIAEDPPKDFPALLGDRDQEWWAQQASWGLMQVMGAVARQHGFMGPYLSELCNPAVGLEYGCLHLAELLSWAKGDIESALAAYNGGKNGNHVKPFRNQAYATKVITAFSMLKGAK